MRCSGIRPQHKVTCRLQLEAAGNSVSTIATARQQVSALSLLPGDTGSLSEGLGEPAQELGPHPPQRPQRQATCCREQHFREHEVTLVVHFWRCLHGRLPGLQALVDRPDETRRVMNFKRLALTDHKLDVPRLAKKKAIKQALESNGEQAADPQSRCSPAAGCTHAMPQRWGQNLRQDLTMYARAASTVCCRLLSGALPAEQEARGLNRGACM